MWCVLALEYNVSLSAYCKSVIYALFVVIHKFMCKISIDVSFLLSIISIYALSCD